eukprot:gene1516-10486_t
MAENPPCEGTKVTSCGVNYVLAYVYFYGFIIICAFLIVNLFVTVIVESFFAIQDRVNRTQVLISGRFAQFMQMWQHFDPAGTGRVRADSLLTMLKKVGEPLWCNTEESEKLHTTEFLMMLHEAERYMTAPVSKGKHKVSYNQVVSSLALRVCRLEIGEGMRACKIANLGKKYCISGRFIRLHHYLAVDKLLRWKRRGYRAAAPFGSHMLQTGQWLPGLKRMI